MTGYPKFKTALITAALLIVTAGCAPTNNDQPTEEGWMSVDIEPATNVGTLTHVWGELGIEVPTDWQLEPGLVDEEELGAQSEVVLITPPEWDGMNVAPVAIQVDPDDVVEGSPQDYVVEEIESIWHISEEEGLHLEGAAVPQHVNWPGFDVAAGMVFISSGVETSGAPEGSEGFVLIGIRDELAITVVVYPENGKDLAGSTAWEVARSMTFT